jgi:hypothetical protein
MQSSPVSPPRQLHKRNGSISKPLLPIVNKQPIQDHKESNPDDAYDGHRLIPADCDHGGRQHEHEEQQGYEDGTHAQDRRGLFETAPPQSFPADRPSR